MTQYIVAVFLDGTLNVAASGPYRSRDRADAACDALNAAGEWSEAHSDQATIIAQVVPLQPLVDLIEDAQPEPREQESVMSMTNPRECCWACTALAMTSLQSRI